MSSLITLVLVYVGHYSNFSGLLGLPPNRVEVENGRTTLVGPERDVSATARLIGLMYQAFPEGSDELTAALKSIQENSNGSSALQTSGTEPDGSANVPSDSRPEGDTPPEEGADLGSGSADAPAGGEGSVPVGDGSKDLVNGEPAPEAVNPKLLKALARLDPSNSQHWTAAGQPAISAVEKFYGSTDIRRSDIAEAAPSLTRATAPKLIPANA